MLVRLKKRLIFLFLVPAALIILVLGGGQASCSNVSGHVFTSKDLHRTSLGPQGPFTSHYTLSFDRLGIEGSVAPRAVAWYHAPAAQTGYYSCYGNLIIIKFFDISRIAFYSPWGQFLFFDGDSYLLEN